MSTLFYEQDKDKLHFQYDTEFIIEGADPEIVDEVLLWCCQNAVDKWSYIKITEHTNVRPYPKLRNLWSDIEDLAKDSPFEVIDFLGDGAYRSYIRITFKSKKDGVTFKLRWA